ncbi:MAG: alpha/beta hydrolase [Gordonia sp. (in: high G+C Gram-positive bacteria)]|uniref:alpha/beta hydrolase n=1 Tax=Gordonia sp. (in: high G+C Gram-positive bacteria) TaxID=84139 RepID=UPI0039E374C9
MSEHRSHLRTAIVAGTAAAAVAAGAVTATHAFADPEGTATTATPTGAQAPGTVYANRELPRRALPSAADSGSEFTFWTVDDAGTPRGAVATLFTPKGVTPAAGWPTVVNLPAAYGLAARCMATSNPAAADTSMSSALLRRGYAVIIPDYGTVGNVAAPQYDDAQDVARVASDAVIAGRTVDDGLSARWAATGDVQGASAAVELTRQATGWQKSPLDFRGASAASVPAGLGDLVAGLGPDSPTASASVVTDVVYTLAASKDPALTDVLSATGRKLVDRAASVCAGELRRSARGTTLASLVSSPMSSQPKLAASLRKQLTVPARGFARPLLLSQPLVDDSVDLSSSARYLADAQLASNKVQIASYPTGDPLDADRQERTRVLDYLDGLFK